MKTALIIPAYRPGMELLELLARFRDDADFQPVVVDDGSGPAFDEIFEAASNDAALLRHEVNLGKGVAIKDAIRYALNELPECDLAITADADGQHRYEDILRVRDAALSRPNALVLGGRRFDGNVPLRSRWGNAITRRVFAVASGRKIYDTQTGLRAFGRAAMERFVNVPGERYEYETNVLLEAAQSGMEFVELPIQTVYLNENSSSHFHPFRDSLKIYMCIFKFGMSSLLAAAIDYILVLSISALTRGLAPAASLAVSVVGARLVSATVNFCVNRSVVFKGDETLGRALAKYAALAACILAVNYALMHLLTIALGWPLPLAKLLVELLLFTVSFTVQGKFVYRGKGRNA